MYSAIALSYCAALKNLLPCALHSSGSTAGASSLEGEELEEARCGGGRGASSESFPLSLPFTPFAAGNAPGADGAGEEGGSCDGDVAPFVSAAADMMGYKRFRSSGGRLSGCVS